VVQLALWVEPAKKVQEKSVQGKLPEQEEAVEREEQVLEEQGEQKQEEVLEPLELQVSPEQEAGLSVPEFGGALSPLCLLMNEIPWWPGQQAPPFSG
jgi:hypothetical protein